MTIPSMMAIFSGLLLVGCQTWGPTWSEISGERYYNLTTLNRRAAIIERVDEQGAFAQYPIKVAPGIHQVTVQGPVLRPGGGYLKSFTLDAKPCKRYYINAQFKNRVELDFEPVVDYVDDIAGCVVASSK
jgi:hypothetical protein